MPTFVRTSDLAQYDIPDTETYKLASLELHRVAVEQTPKFSALEYYKLEYEKGVQRHDDLYKAAWTNFSYMAIVAGAILTFGGDRFLPELSALLACIPLLFWWLASFEPLNRYGDQVIDQLSGVEANINDTFQLQGRWKLSHFTKFKERKGQPPSTAVKAVRWVLTILIFAGLVLLGLNIFDVWRFDLERRIVGIALLIIIALFILFDRRESQPPKKNVFYLLRSVRFAVRCFACVQLVVAICLVAKIIKEGKPLLVQKSSEVKVIPVDFNDNLGFKLDGITAKQAQELLQKAEQQKTASEAGK